MGFDVTCAVPRSGRTLHNFLGKLKTLAGNSEEIDQILQISTQSKRNSSTQLKDVLQYLSSLPPETPDCFSVFVDRKRNARPYRLGFLGYEWNVGGVKLRVEGEEPHNGSSLIKLDEVDFTVVGLDELLSMSQYYLKDPTQVTKWGMYNYHLDKPTGMRIAGSAMLTTYSSLLKKDVQDMVGFFLISKPDSHRGYALDLKKLSSSGQRVFVKGRYTGIVTAAYPGLKITSVEDVEDAVLESEKGGVGLEIVQSGNTLRKKSLVLHGAPLFLSESLYVVDYDRFVACKPLKKTLEYLDPIGYFDERRIKHFARWYFALEKNLGDHWLHRPSASEMFCTPTDPEHGLRPYRLKTRSWKPDDLYQRDAASELIQKAEEQLMFHYEQLKLEFS